MKRYQDCPLVLRDFLAYHESIKGQSPRTIDEYYLDIEYVTNEIKAHGVFTNDFDEIVLNNDEVFLMGDNRVHSLDSRLIGPFKLSSIKSKDIFIFWPLNHGGVVK